MRWFPVRQDEANDEVFGIEDLGYRDGAYVSRLSYRGKELKSATLALDDDDHDSVCARRQVADKAGLESLGLHFKSWDDMGDEIDDIAARAPHALRRAVARVM